MRRGPYDSMEATYSALFEYVKENGLEVVVPTREVYLTDPSQVQRPEDILTQVLLPL